MFVIFENLVNYSSEKNVYRDYSHKMSQKHSNIVYNSLIFILFHRKYSKYSVHTELDVGPATSCINFTLSQYRRSVCQKPWLEKPWITSHKCFINFLLAKLKSAAQTADDVNFDISFCFSFACSSSGRIFLISVLFPFDLVRFRSFQYK